MTLFIKKISTEIAQNVWDNSSKSSIFNNPNFLECFTGISFYGCFLNKKLVTVWPVYLRKEKISEIPWNSYYFGPFFEENFQLKPFHSRLPKLLKIYESYLLFFKPLFKEINFRFHWQNQDIRFFKWFKEQYNFCNITFDAKYTAILENSFDIKEWRALRRRQLKKIVNLKDEFFFTQKKDQNISEYLNIIKENVPEVTFDEYRSSYEMLIKACIVKGECTEIFDKKNNETIGFACVLEDKISHNMVFNFVRKDWKKKGMMVFLYKRLFEKCFTKKISYFDFNGANSIIGADEKSTFGTSTKLYFDIKIRYL